MATSLPSGDAMPLVVTANALPSTSSAESLETVEQRAFNLATLQQFADQHKDTINAASTMVLQSATQALQKVMINYEIVFKNFIDQDAYIYKKNKHSFTSIFCSLLPQHLQLQQMSQHQRLFRPLYRQ